MKVLITGANGFIGKNLAAQLAVRKGFEVLRVGRESTQDDWQDAMSEADFICHLAGVNRPNDENEFVRINIGLTQEMCEMIQKSGRNIPIIFVSSAQVEKDNPYGRRKLAAEKIVLRYATEMKAPVYIFRLPNVIGKWCRPNYNSAVATFCYNISHGLPIQINDPNYKMKIVYIDDLVSAFANIILSEGSSEAYCEVQPTYEATIGEVVEQLRMFHRSRSSLISERVGAGFSRVLYATYLSYLSPVDFSYEVPKHGDSRGILVEMLKTKDSGQFSFFTAHPGVTRGGHYHHSKTEKFLVIQGKAKFRFRHVLTQETHEISTSSEKPEIVESIPGWAHDITNVGDDEMIVMLWASEIFDRDRPDTYTCPI